MTRETRIGLLVGLMFIIMFGLVLSELAGTEGVVSPPRRGDQVAAEARGDDVGEISTFCVLPTPPPRRSRPTPVAPAKDSSAGGIKRPRATVTVDRVASGGKVKAPVPTPGVYPDHKSERHMLAAIAREAALPPVPSPPARPAPTRPAPGVVLVAPIPPVRPAPMPAIRKYCVRKEDSLIAIARKMYGQSRWREYRRIFAANRDILPDENALRPGQVLVIPPLPGDVAGGDVVVEATTEELRARFADDLTRPAAAVVRPPSRLYKVRSGDNLTKIARRILRDDSWSAVQRIVRANKSKISNPNDLSVGATLVIPS